MSQPSPGCRRGRSLQRLTVILVIALLALGADAGAQVPPGGVTSGVTGVVIDEQGAPVAGVSIAVRRAEGEHAVSPTRTAEDGSFTLEGLAGERDLALDLQAPDGRRRLVFDVAAPSSGLLDLGRIVLPQPARLEGRVIAPDGSGLPQVEVSLYTAGVVLERIDGELQATDDRAVSLGRCRTDAEGRFELSTLPPGWATVATLAPGFAPDIRTVLLRAGSVAQVEARPEPGFSIRGRLAAPAAGPPMSGQVSTSRSRSSFPSHDAIQRERATLGTDGAWELADLPAGQWFVQPKVSGYDGKPVAIELPSSGDGLVDLPLVAHAPESGSIEATVVDEQGQPVEAFTLWCASFWGAKSVPGGLSIPWSEWVPFAFEPGAAGHARLGPLETGEYQLIATTADGRVSTTTRVSVRSEPEPAVATLSLGPAESLRVEVVDERTGQPLPGATVGVDLRSISQPLERQVDTDAAGTAVIGRLPRGPVDLRVFGALGDKPAETSVTLPHPDVVRLVGQADRILHVRLSRDWRAQSAPGEWFDRSFALLVRDSEGALVGMLAGVVESAALALPAGDYRVLVAAFDPAALFTSDSQGLPQPGWLLRGEGTVLAVAEVSLGDGPVTTLDF